MALLGSDFDRDVPAGSESPTLGDNNIRDVKARVQDWANIEHDGGTGGHKIPRGATLPSATVVGQLYIKTGTFDELYEYNGTAWNKITSNQDVATYSADLTTHEALTDLTLSGGHATDSVRSGTIKAGEIGQGHLYAAGDKVTPLADLVNGSANGNTYHTHGLAAPTTVDFVSTNPTYTFPVIISSYEVEAWGGGGGGASGGGDTSGDAGSAPSGGGGGSGGYIKHRVVLVTPSTPTIAVIVGTGGAGGVGNTGLGTNGTDGGDTTVSQSGVFSLLAGGGKKGTHPSAPVTKGIGGVAGQGDAGGSVTYYPPVDVFSAGNAGADGVDNGTGAGGDGGVGVYGMFANIYGAGGPGGTGNGAGGASGYSGLAGTNGYVKIRY